VLKQLDVIHFLSEHPDYLAQFNLMTGRCKKPSQKSNLAQNTICILLEFDEGPARLSD